MPTVRTTLIRTRLRVGAVGVAAGAMLLAGPLLVTPAAGEDDRATTSAQSISLEDTLGHLDRLQEIADANGGNRGMGRPGFRESLTWVKSELDKAGFETRVQRFDSRSGKSSNLIAEWPAGDPDSVVMVGAHLDGVRDGPGMSDNGSGTAGVLETALTFAESNPQPKNRLRFVFWGAEEIGLVGSHRYAKRLSSQEINRLRVYLNFDMIGSPNPGYFVYNDNPAGKFARDDLTAWWDSVDLPWEYASLEGSSDHSSFMAFGVPTSGTFTGVSGRWRLGTKTRKQVKKWGGTTGPFDRCYHRTCDNRDNISEEALKYNIDAIGHLVFSYADKDFGPIRHNGLRNPGFESGRAAWETWGRAIIGKGTTAEPARSGVRRAVLSVGNAGGSGSKELIQRVSIPRDAQRARLTYWLRINTAERSKQGRDRLLVQALTRRAETLGRHSSRGVRDRWVRRSVDLSDYAGRTLYISFSTAQDTRRPTSFLLDDMRLTYRG